MRVGWATDIHLNFLERPARQAFAETVRAQSPDVFLLAGDLAESHDFAPLMADFAAQLDLPIWYVLGNHDYYGAAVANVRARTRLVEQASPRLRWLPDHGVVALTERTGLVGHDGWGDARHGSFETTRVMLNDFLRIEDLAREPRALRTNLQRLGDEAGEHFARVLPEALERFEHVLVVTHVPPFEASCTYQGKPGSAEWLPFFTCKAVGDRLREAMEARPDRKMTVLCGHSHDAASVDVLPNLCALTGGAEYGAPAPQAVIEVE
jgi:predicted phosphohydrolase